LEKASPVDVPVFAAVEGDDLFTNVLDCPRALFPSEPLGTSFEGVLDGFFTCDEVGGLLGTVREVLETFAIEALP
jgi:hypothetical protein